ERTDIDDLAAAAPHHAPARLAADDEGGGQVDVEDTLPFGRRQVDHGFSPLDAGIIDQDVDGNAIIIECLECGDDRRLVRDIEGDAVRLISLIAHFSDGRSDAGRVGAVQDDPGAGGCQALCQGTAETAGRSGYQ